MTRDPIGKGDSVRFSPKKIRVYQQIYDITEDDVCVVEHVEPRYGKRVLYVQKKGREGWIPAYPSALLVVKRAPTPA